MSATVDISADSIVTALGAFIQTVVTVPVIRAQTNRVPMPVGDFIALTPVSAEPLDVSVDSNTATALMIKRSTQYRIQVDCYGLSAGDNAQMLATLLRDDYAYDAMEAANVAPLYATDARQMPLIAGEDQYIQRWTFEAYLQANPTTTVTIQTADALNVETVDVDRVYPP